MVVPSLIADWQHAHQFHSVRLALAGGVLNGVAYGLSAFVYAIDPWWFLIINMVLYVAIAFVRIVKQQGLDDAN